MFHNFFNNNHIELFAKAFGFIFIWAMVVFGIVMLALDQHYVIMTVLSIIAVSALSAQFLVTIINDHDTKNVNNFKDSDQK